jgi:hypothetical protein
LHFYNYSLFAKLQLSEPGTERSGVLKAFTIPGLKKANKVSEQNHSVRIPLPKESNNGFWVLVKLI